MVRSTKKSVKPLAKKKMTLESKDTSVLKSVAKLRSITSLDGVLRRRDANRIHRLRLRAQGPFLRALTLFVFCTSLLLGPQNALGQHEEAVAPVIDSFWARKAIAVQDRQIKKKGALGISLAFGVVPTDPLRVYLPIAIRLAYHITESWALEGSFAYNFVSETALHSLLRSSGTDPAIWERESHRWRANGAVIWSPVYGKISTGSRIFHLEFYLLAGAGAVYTQKQPSLNFEAVARPEFVWGAGLRLLAGRRWMVRFAYRQHLALRPKSSGIAWPAELSLGLGVLLGGSR